MNLFGMLEKLYSRYRIWRLRRAGLVMGEGCSITGLPFFGSEPYLITIGNNVGIADDVSFITHDGGTRVFRHLERYKNVLKYGRITIHDNCVIGQRAILLPGVTIGPNSVVAAGSVVSRSIPPGVLAAGNPAKPVMTFEQYAEWSLASTPTYDMEAYRRDKKAVLLKMHMRGGARRQPAAAAPAPVTPAPGEGAGTPPA
jgi:acetyltransferase-like isoleucine patch superfamily enzyme